MLSNYLNQRAEHTPAERNGNGSAVMDSRGGIKYLAPVVISCRKQYRKQEILTATSQLIKTTWVYYLNIHPRVDDKLDGLRIQDVEDWVTLEGAVIGYKAVV